MRAFIKLSQFMDAEQNRYSIENTQKIAEERFRDVFFK